MANDAHQYTKRKHRLVLLAWLNSLFGYRSNKEMLGDCKEVALGFGIEDSTPTLYLGW